jgi:nucleoid DNA-binding protein
MTKADLVDIVAGKTGLTKRDVAAVVEALLEAIKASLAQHRHIEIREFGTFKVKLRKASMKYNPRDRSQKVVVPQKMVPVFKPSKFLKERVNWQGQPDESEDRRSADADTDTTEGSHVQP